MVWLDQRICVRQCRYSVLNGGKRLRPLLVYVVGAMYGANLKSLDVPACVLEILHSFTLVHDDLPCMDNDDLRRGKLTCHKKFDEASAILAGDALTIFAFQVLNNTKMLSSEQIVVMNRILVHALGTQGVAGGQDIDIYFSGKKLSVKGLEQMYELKTAALIGAAVKLGAIAAGVTDKKELYNLDQFAKNVGLAFQIHDDIFNIESTEKKLGKSIGTDCKHKKNTYPLLLSVDIAKNRMSNLYKTAEKFLHRLQVDSGLLLAYIEYVKQRDS